MREQQAAVAAAARQRALTALRLEASARRSELEQRRRTRQELEARVVALREQARIGRVAAAVELLPMCSWKAGGV